MFFFYWVLIAICLILCDTNSDDPKAANDAVGGKLSLLKGSRKMKFTKGHVPRKMNRPNTKLLLVCIKAK